MAITCCGRKVKCYSRRICGDWEPEYQNLRDTSVLLFASGVLGLLCATCAIALFPFQPSVNAGSLCMFGSALSCVTALVTLCCCRGTQSGAYHAALFCMVIQLLCTASLVYAGAGTSFDFCAAPVKKTARMQAKVLNDLEQEQPELHRVCRGGESLRGRVAGLLTL